MQKPILFLIDELEVGGSQRQILLLARALREAGHAVTVAYFREENANLRPAFEAAGVKTRLVRKGRGFDARFLFRLGQLLASDRDWRVLTFGYTASLWTRLAGWPRGSAPSVSCIRNLGYLPRSAGALAAVMKGVERVLASRSRWVVANSQVTADSVVARGIIPKHKMLVIPNAVEATAPEPRASSRARLDAIVASGASGTGADARPGARSGGQPDGRPMVGTLARLVDVKDLPTLLRAARHVVDARADARFVIGGEGPARGRLETLRRELGLDGKVFFPGTLDGREVITGLDVAVLTSSSEGMPNFVLEAMAAGVPIVSTRVGAAAELLDGGALGRLVAVGDGRGVAEGILGVLRDPAGARGQAERAAAKVRDLTPARIAGRYLELFEETGLLVGGPHGD